MYQAIAKAGHICYASEKEGDEEVFVQRCIKMGHMRPLEFGTVYLNLPMDFTDIQFYFNDPYTKVLDCFPYYYVTTNYRVLVEHGHLDDLKYWSEPTEYHYKRHTILWEHIARDIADEFRTHTGLSSLMQSTRYCAYNKDKFGNQLTFIKPSWVSHCDYYAMKEDEREIFRAFENAENHYIRLMNKWGWSAEKARKVIPLGLATTYIQ